MQEATESYRKQPKIPQGDVIPGINLPPPVPVSYLFLPSPQGTPPRDPGHGFLLRSEVLGREKGEELKSGLPWLCRVVSPWGTTLHPTWSLVFSDSDELSEFSPSDGDPLAGSTSLGAFRARLDADICRGGQPEWWVVGH